MKSITIKDTIAIFRNFRGLESDYNRAGDRNFSIVLDETMANDLKAQGFNVRVRPARNEGDDDQYTLKVNVSYRYSAPNIYVVADGVRTPITEDNVDMLDRADIDFVDLSITPSTWEMRGRTGVSAYLKSMYVYLRVDDLDREWNENHHTDDFEENPF